MKCGDVAIQRKPGTSICRFGLVWDDDQDPPYWWADTVTEAKEWAKSVTDETGGTIHESEYKPPTSN